MKLKGILDGKDIEVEITDDQVKELINSKRWKPKYGDAYFHIGVHFDICYGSWIDSSFDELNYEYRNVFKIRKEAEFEVEKRKVLDELEIFAKENNDTSNIYIEKPTIYYDFINKAFKVIWTEYTVINAIYFSSKELAERAIELYGDRLKKYVIGVKE